METIICPACQSPNASDLEFCIVCGYELSQVKPKGEANSITKLSDEQMENKYSISPEVTANDHPTEHLDSELSSITYGKASLVLKDNSNLAKKFILSKDQTYLVGRFDPDTGPVDIDLGDFYGNDTVSRQHGEIFFESGSWKVIDLGSTNGIFIRKNKEKRFSPRITIPSILENGDEVSFGKVRFIFSLEN